ncbi:hypothetical protein [Ralstonia phage RSK1]|uniref:Uncharacterized protein n=1 Tax=Ralstonia phage RSK1 TaxID=1417599 RepID=U6C800_9CAUD|nr:hypothetical protein X532_gp26 [Ralstonia phage RSK1]BAO04691.1 hypothetical protein [Ralstonia phage RSK1]
MHAPCDPFEHSGHRAVAVRRGVRACACGDAAHDLLA